MAFALIVLLFPVLAVPDSGTASTAPPHETAVYFFWRAGCPHCERETELLQALAQEQPALRVHYFDALDPANARLLKSMRGMLQGEIASVPITIIGQRAWIGYGDHTTTGKSIREHAASCVAQGCPDVLAGLVRSSDAVEEVPGIIASPNVPDTIRLPLVGEIEIATLSLPVLTVVLGLLDGFNPCAMWVLALLLGILVGLPDARRRWLLGAVFLFTSAAVYFLFMSAWLNLFLFVGLVWWVQLAVGFAALFAGAYYLRQYVLNRDAVCVVAEPARRQRVFERVKNLARRESLWLAIAGVALLAAAVNLVELLCSAGLPAIYTQVLALSQVPRWQYYAYLILYVTIFLLDDLIVFVLAMKTLEVAGVGQRYMRHSRLIGGVVLTLLGTLLILRPDWLMFG